MKTVTRVAFCIFALILLAGSSVAWSKDQFRVVASIKPIHSLVAGLMEGLDGLQLIVPQGRIPFDYQLTEAQLADLQQADLVFWAGPELEGFLIEPLSRLGSDTTVETLLDSMELKILPARWSEEERDPFFWLDTRNAIILVDEIAKRLMADDPAHAHLYSRNRKKLLGRVAELDRRFEYGYRGFKGGVGLAYFDTLQYFEQAYALKVGNTVTSLQHPGVSGTALLTNRAKLNNGEFACLLLEREVEAKELPLLLSADSNVPSAELDTFGTQFTPGTELYFELMEYNTNTIKGCLNSQANTKKKHAVLEDDELYPAYAPIEGKFLLVDHNSKLVTEKDLLGKYQLIYFGYTYCPDVCPTSLQVMSAALQKMGERASLIQPYFISVDPERDTLEVINQYVSYFGNNLIGLTGTPSMIQRVTEQYRVRYEKVLEEGRDPDEYLMDHTASFYLVAPDGTFITKLAYGLTADQVVEKLNEYLPAK
ncbi:MAG: hypothetical protein C0631_11970 [Sedimenticola sp.]|mgnify:CR=1 FL=1|nr:MAG: hypothetical protein C0631_11970 [Sedimenticola sp.]